VKALRKAIYARLKGDNSGAGNLASLATGGIVYGAADRASALPICSFQKMTGLPQWSFTEVAATEFFYLVKGIAFNAPDGSYTGQERAEDIDARCKELLNDFTLSIAGGTCLYLRHERDIPDYPEPVGKTAGGGEILTAFHVGSIYRAEIQ
jgi:hypothetical protein